MYSAAAKAAVVAISSSWAGEGADGERGAVVFSPARLAAPHCAGAFA